MNSSLHDIGSDNDDDGQMNWSPTRSYRRGIAFTCSAILAASLTACSPTMNSHGNIPDSEVIQSIRIGSSNREQVSQMLGTPSAVATFDKEAWYYVGSRTSRLAFLEPTILERKILVIRFDKKGIVQQVERLEKQDGREVQIVDRKTPTRGKELSVMEQLLGNVGRFGGAGGGENDGLAP